ATLPDGVMSAPALGPIPCAVHQNPVLRGVSITSHGSTAALQASYPLARCTLGSADVRQAALPPAFVIPIGASCGSGWPSRRYPWLRAATPAAVAPLTVSQISK